MNGTTKVVPKSTTRVSIVPSGGGRPMAALTPSLSNSVLRLEQDDLLDTTVIHGDGTTTAAKKGADNIGFSGHKKVKGDKVVAFCDRRCNVIAPFVSAPGLIRRRYGVSLPARRAVIPRVQTTATTKSLRQKYFICRLRGTIPVAKVRRWRGAAANAGQNPQPIG